MIKRKNPALSIVLYILAGMMALYAVWSIITSSSYIAELMASGQLAFSGNEFDIIDFFVSNSSQYIVYAFILFALGRAYQELKNIVINENKPLSASSETTENNDIY